MNERNILPHLSAYNLIMNHDLDYFNDFLNNPASLNNEEFKRKFMEWLDFLKANPKKYGMKGRGWKRAWRRIGKDLNRRDDIRDEFDELDAEMQACEKSNEAERIKLNRRWMNFVKAYQFEYGFSDEDIARCEDGINAFEKAVRKVRICEIKSQIAQGELQASTDKFADAMFEAQDKYGKPIMFPSYKISKRGQGN